MTGKGQNLDKLFFMKYTFLLVALSMLVYHVQAQTAKLVLNPKELSMQTGETNTVSVQVENADFDYQLFLSVAHSDLGSSAAIDFRINPLNPPYVSSIDISIQGAPAPGRHQLVIKAANGPLAFNDTCYITIPETDCAWESFDINHPAGDIDYHISVDSENNAWLALGTQFAKRTPDGILTTYTYAFEQSSYFDKILVDKNDNIWLSWLAGDMHNSIHKYGLLYYNHHQFSYYNSSNSPLPESKINDMVCDSQNNLWLATDMGIFKFDGSFWSHYNTTNTTISSNVITAITVDNNDAIWCIIQREDLDEESEIVQYSNAVWNTYSKSYFCTNVRPFNFNFKATDIAIDSSDNIWLSLSPAGGGYSLLKASQEQVYFYGNDRNTNGYPEYRALSKNTCEEVQSASLDINIAQLGTLKAAAENEIWYGASTNVNTTVYHYNNGEWTVYSYLNSALPNTQFSDLALGRNHSVFVSSTITDEPQSEGPYLSILHCEEPIVTSYTGDARRSDAQISIYPNPAQNELYLNIQNLDLKPESIRVIDVHGNVIPAAITAQQGAFYKIDVADLVSGIYHITFLSNGKIVSQRFVKM